MADGAAVEVNFPGPAPYEHRTTTVGATTGQDTTEEVVTPRQEAAQVALEHQTEDEVALARRKQAQAEKVAGAELQNVEAAQFVEQGLEALRTGPEAQKARDYIDMARARLRSEQDRLDKMPAPALFADRDAWGKVRLGIGFALAGLGDGMMAAAAIRAGHAPMRATTAQTIIENDLNRQREAINRQRDRIVMARAGVDDAKEARNILLADVELKGKAMYKQLELLQRARLASLKLDQPSIDATKEILDANRAQKEQEAKFADAHGKNVKSRWDSAKTTVEDINRTPAATTGKGGVEAEKNSVNYNLFKEHGTWLRDALPTLTEKDQQDIGRVFGSAQFFDKNTSAEALMTLVGADKEMGMSPQAKAFIAHAREAADAKGRIKSGGAVNIPEEKRFVGGLLAPPSDRGNPKNLAMRQGIIDTDIRVMSTLDRGGTPPAAGVPGKPNGANPPKEVPFTRAGVLKMKAITKDKNRTRKERDDATAYIRAAHNAGVD